MPLRDLLFGIKWVCAPYPLLPFLLQKRMTRSMTLLVPRIPLPKNCPLPGLNT